MTKGLKFAHRKANRMHIAEAFKKYKCINVCIKNITN